VLATAPVKAAQRSPEDVAISFSSVLPVIPIPEDESRAALQKRMLSAYGDVLP